MRERIFLTLCAVLTLTLGCTCSGGRVAGSSSAEVLALKSDYDGIVRIEPQWKRILDAKPVTAAHYNRLACDTLFNTSVLHRYRSQLANTIKHYDEALAEADSAIADASALGDALAVGNLEQRATALEGLGRYKESLSDVKQMKALDDSITRADNREQLNLLN